MGGFLAFRVDPLRQRRERHTSGRIYQAGVLIAADKRFLGPAVAPAPPNVSRDGFCSIAVLQNPLDAV
jgi:hypothetical protein